MARLRVALIPGALLLVAAPAAAQPLGTFRWQLQPFCNVITVTVTQVGGLYRLEGTDDQCGRSVAASVIGTAFLNPDGSIGLGFNVVSAPGGEPHPVSATLRLPSMSGTWRAEPSQTGAFTFTPGAPTAGYPRPLPVPVTIPPVIRLQTDGGFLAGLAEGTARIPAEGAGTRMMWHAGKAAFRAGRVSGGRWDDATIGSYSMALGDDTQADRRRQIFQQPAIDGDGIRRRRVGVRLRGSAAGVERLRGADEVQQFARDAMNVNGERHASVKNEGKPKLDFLDRHRPLGTARGSTSTPATAIRRPCAAG